MKIDRATSIRQQLYARGPLSVAELAEAVGASEPTVRRDLLALERAGAVVRTHGGARIADSAGIEVAFERREQIALSEKRAIGEAAHRLIRPETAVFLDAGTTVLQLARCLRLDPVPVRVFTNCLPVAQMLMPVLNVTLLGGTIRPQNASLVGALAEEALERLWFDQLFLGTGAVAESLEMSSADEQEARLNRLMLKRSAAPVLMADAGKFGARLTWTVAPISPALHVISDAGLAPDWRGRLTETGCRLTLATPST